MMPPSNEVSLEGVIAYIFASEIIGSHETLTAIPMVLLLMPGAPLTLGIFLAALRRIATGW